MEVWVTGHNFESWPFKDHSCYVCCKLAYFQRIFFNFPIGSYVESMSADGGDLGWRSWSQDIILKVDYLRTIHALFTLNWLTGFRGSYVNTKSSHDGHLEFPIGKRFRSLVQDHPMIIPAKSQFNWLGGFWQEDFLNFSQWEHIMEPGSHVGIQISIKNINLVEDHPMNISGKFGSILFSPGSQNF